MSQTLIFIVVFIIGFVSGYLVKEFLVPKKCKSKPATPCLVGSEQKEQLNDVFTSIKDSIPLANSQTTTPLDDIQTVKISQPFPFYALFSNSQNTTTTPVPQDTIQIESVDREAYAHIATGFYHIFWKNLNKINVIAEYDLMKDVNFLDEVTALGVIYIGEIDKYISCSIHQKFNHNVRFDVADQHCNEQFDPHFTKIEEIFQSAYTDVMTLADNYKRAIENGAREKHANFYNFDLDQVDSFITYMKEDDGAMYNDQVSKFVLNLKDLHNDE